MAKKIANININKSNEIAPVTITAVDGRKKKVKEEQEMLQKLGLYTGKIDGIVGPLTEDARMKHIMISSTNKSPLELNVVDTIAKKRNQSTGAIDRAIKTRMIDTSGQAYYSDTLVAEKDFPKYVSKNKDLISRNPAYRHITEESYKFAKGGQWDETMLGAGSGAATGAGIGFSVGGPVGAAIGTGIGALAGGISSWIGSKRRTDEEEEFNRNQKKLQAEARRTSDLGEFSQYANAGEGYNLDRVYAAKGGRIQQVASNIGIAKGATHEEGGITLEEAEVENNETVMQDGSATKVFSDELGYSTLANTLAKEKGILETKLLNTISSVERTLGIMKQSSNKYETAGHEHKVNMLSHKADMIKQNIDSVEAALNSLFEEQQDVNGDNSNVNPTQGRSMARPRVASNEPVPFEKGGLIAEDGIKLMGKSNPWDKPSWGRRTWDKTVDFGSNVLSKGKEFAAEKPELTSGLLFSAGNLLSNVNYNIAAKKVKVPEPIQDKAYTAEARVDTSAQESAVDQSTRRISNYVSSNISNPTVARQIMMEAESRAGETKTVIKGQKENIEGQIRRDNLANIQGVDSRNIAKQEQYLAEQHNKEIDDISRGSAIATSFLGDVKQSVAQQRMADYQEMQLRLQALKDVDNVMGSTIMMALNKGMSREEYDKYLKNELGVTDTKNYLAAYDSVNTTRSKTKRKY